jgi:hypothetical protein
MVGGLDRLIGHVGVLRLDTLTTIFFGCTCVILNDSDYGTAIYSFFTPLGIK